MKATYAAFAATLALVVSLLSFGIEVNASVNHRFPGMESSAAESGSQGPRGATGPRGPAGPKTAAVSSTDWASMTKDSSPFVNSLWHTVEADHALLVTSCEGGTFQTQGGTPPDCGTVESIKTS